MTVSSWDALVFRSISLNLNCGTRKLKLEQEKSEIGPLGMVGVNDKKKASQTCKEEKGVCRGT